MVRNHRSIAAVMPAAICRRGNEQSPIDRSMGPRAIPWLMFRAAVLAARMNEPINKSAGP
jgi:hypothetical protein